MYEISYILPDSRQMKPSLLKMDDSQAELHRLVLKIYQGVPTLKTGRRWNG
jgi:hypothetical protein